MKFDRFDLSCFGMIAVGTVVLVTGVEGTLVVTEKRAAQACEKAGGRYVVRIDECLRPEIFVTVPK